MIHYIFQVSLLAVKTIPEEYVSFITDVLIYASMKKGHLNLETADKLRGSKSCQAMGRKATIALKKMSFVQIKGIATVYRSKQS